MVRKDLMVKDFQIEFEREKSRIENNILELSNDKENLKKIIANLENDKKFIS